MNYEDDQDVLPSAFYDSKEMYDMALTKQESEKLDEACKAVVEVRTVLIGVDGNPGLLSRFEELAKSHYGFKRAAVSVFLGIVFSGIITGAILLLT